MEFAAGGYLPFDGGDESPTNSHVNPFQWRNSPTTLSGSYTSSGVGQHGSITVCRLAESRYSKPHPVSYLGRSHGNIGGKFAHTKLYVQKLGDRFSPSTAPGAVPSRAAEGMFAPSQAFINSITQDNLNTFTKCEQAVTGKTPYTSNTNLDAYGATAIARVAPTNPLVDLSTSAAELLREGLPSVPGNAGNLGGEYLNIMFGYLPLVADAKELSATARNHDALLRQYERDSGRWIRRRYRFPDEVETNILHEGNAATALYGTTVSGLTQVGQRTTTTTTRTRTWFSGAFTYHLPQSGWRRSAAELDHLYGIRPGLDTAWELVGYSWLVDYFTNVGDVMKNITAFKQDGLVMPYGYIMQEREVRREEVWHGNMRFSGVWVPTTVSGVITYTTHQRRLANPFGFGVTYDGLTGRQMSILAALGISRL